jgi:hypothetical protein
LGANIISLQLRIDNVQFFVVRCYIPPSDLETLTDVERAWQACPTGVHPLLVGNMNFNFCAPCMDHEEAIAEQVEAMGLVDMSKHFYQRLGKWLRGTRTWWMRREGRWISSQCNYFFGRETDRRRFQCVSVRMPHYYSDHRALVAVIHTGGGGELKRYHQRTQRFPISLPRSPRKHLDAEYEELQQDVVCPPLRERPANSWITTKTWKLINHRAMLRRKGMLSQTAARGLGRQVKAQLAADRIKRAKNTALTIEGSLQWGILWRRGVISRGGIAWWRTGHLKPAKRHWHCRRQRELSCTQRSPPQGG